MGLGDIIGDILGAATENLPEIVAQIRGRDSPQARSFAPAPTRLGQGITEMLGLDAPQPAGGGALPRGFPPALFRPSMATGRPSPRRRIEIIPSGTNRVYAYAYLGRPILYSGDRSVARRWAKITGHTLGRRGAGRPSRRRRPR
jgi:hypothetical protein